MRLRQAKKIHRDFSECYIDGTFVHSDEQIKRAQGRLRKYRRNSLKGKITTDSLRLARFVENNPKELDEIVQRWNRLKLRIILNWNPDDWSDREYVLGYKNALQRIGCELYWAFVYCSDRWCSLRVGRIDGYIEEFTNGSRKR